MFILSIFDINKSGGTERDEWQIQATLETFYSLLREHIYRANWKKEIINAHLEERIVIVAFCRASNDSVRFIALNKNRYIH